MIATYEEAKVCPCWKVRFGRDAHRIASIEIEERSHGEATEEKEPLTQVLGCWTPDNAPETG